jgi:hypothetical protein
VPRILRNWGFPSALKVVLYERNRNGGTHLESDDVPSGVRL